jgi:hypothetical protein
MPTRPAMTIAETKWRGASARFSKFARNSGPAFTNFEKSGDTSKFMISVPLFYLKSLDRIRGSERRNFK